jgi:glucuronoarabinoxylan endo-1,4-beta-xylanase
LSKGTTVAVNLVLKPSASINATVDWQDDAAGGAGGVGGSSSTGGTSTGGTTGTGVTVQLAQTSQTIQGFGISDTWASQFTSAVATQLFSADSGIGLSILRVGMSETGAFINSFEASNISAVKGASANAKIIGTVYSPPASCKSNNNLNDGGHLLTNCYDSWSTTIANFARTNSLYAMSLQNEPDFASCGSAEPCNGNYPSTLYTANEMVAFAKIAGPKLKAAGVKVIAPEVSQWNRAWSNVSATGSVPGGKNSSDPLLCGFPPNNNCTTGNGYDYGHYLANDATAWNAFDIFGTHEYYSQTATPWASDVTAAKKEVWMTEMSGLKWWAEQGPSSDINNGVVVARWIHSALVDGQASAWIWWWYQAVGTDDNEGLLLKSGVDTKRHYTLGNFSKFVRPGHVRVAVTGNSSSDLLLSAYKGTDGKVVVVAVNQGTSAVTVPIAITGGTAPTSVTPWVTSSTDNLASKTAIAVTGGSFTASLPSMTVTTFVGN